MIFVFAFIYMKHVYMFVQACCVYACVDVRVCKAQFFNAEGMAKARGCD